MRWRCLDGFGGGRFWGELDVRSRWEAGFCRFWTRGLLLLVCCRGERVLGQARVCFVALPTVQLKELQK